MTDMRATERLLEVIDECIDAQKALLVGTEINALPLLKAEEAITELRRRGDTLVRRDDLRVVLENARLDAGASADQLAAWERLSVALG